MPSRPAPPADIESDLTGPAWRSAFGGAIALMMGPSVLLIMTFGVFLPSLRQEFGWTVAQAALGPAIIAGAIVLSSPLQGFLCDRFGARRVILASAVPFGAGMVAMSWLPGSLATFYVACAVLPVLGIGLWPVAYNKAVAGWFDRRLGMAMGIVAAGIGVGAVIAPSVAAYIIVAEGWRAAFKALGAASAVTALLAAMLLLREPPKAGIAVAGMAGDDFGGALRTVRYRVMLVGFILLGVGTSAILVHQPALLLESGLSLRYVGLLQSVVGVAVIFGRLGVGWLLDRVSTRWIMPPLLLGAALGCALLGSGATGFIVPITACLFGLLIGAEMDVLGYLVRRHHGSRAFGALYGLGFAAFSLGSAIGAGAVGRLHDRFGSYDVPFLMNAAIFAAAAAIFAMPTLSRRSGKGANKG